MSKIFIFAFDTYYPSGGMDSLVAVLDDETGQCVNSDLLIKHDELARVAARHSKDHYQVLHFTQDGGPLLVENWDRESSPTRTFEEQITLPDGDVLQRISIRDAFPGGPSRAG